VPHPALAISLVLPAYNEAHRLPPYLATVRAYLDSRYGQGYEVIVVDDGSSDGHAEYIECLAADWPQLRCIRHAYNQGKGAAVRTGVLAARGASILFADADGATPIGEECRLAAAIRAGADVAVGSRLVDGAGAKRSRHWVRGLAGRLFAVMARAVLRLPIRDTQCGFKMFRGDAGRHLFAMLEEARFLFDLEVLALAVRLGYRCVEVPVNWTEIPGGHLSMTRELPRIVAGLWRLRRRVAKARREEGCRLLTPPRSID